MEKQIAEPESFRQCRQHCFLLITRYLKGAEIFLFKSTAGGLNDCFAHSEPVARSEAVSVEHRKFPSWN